MRVLRQLYQLIVCIQIYWTLSHLISTEVQMEQGKHFSAYLGL